MRAVTLHDPRQMLLDDVLDRFMPDVKEKKFYRRRVLGDKKSLSIPGDYPEQLVTDLKELPPRPTFSPRTTQSMPGSPRGKNRVDRVSGESKAGGSPHHIKDRVGVIGGRNRTVQINNGTKTLEAFTGNQGSGCLRGWAPTAHRVYLRKIHGDNRANGQ